MSSPLDELGGKYPDIPFLGRGQMSGGGGNMSIPQNFFIPVTNFSATLGVQLFPEHLMLEIKSLAKAQQGVLGPLN